MLDIPETHVREVRHAAEIGHFNFTPIPFDPHDVEEAEIGGAIGDEGKQLVRRFRFRVADGYTMPVQQAPISKPVDGLPIELEALG